MSVSTSIQQRGSTAAAWQPGPLEGLATGAWATPPVIDTDDVQRISPDLDIWDAWPIQDDDGTPARLADGATLWMALGAPRFDDPDERHAHARIHLLRETAGAWEHLGPAMPDGFSPGSREWSGSALLEPDRRTVTLFFTATGRRGEAVPTFEQRLFRANATLVSDDGAEALTAWRDLQEIVRRDTTYYMASDAGGGKVGTIKAFRDPAYFRDPADGKRYLFFAGSYAQTDSAFNGVIGVIAGEPADPPAWTLRPPTIDATDVNNELERPHVVVCDGLYYMFWSTQQHVFAPTHASAPTGLYGMVAASLDGDWRPLNGTGLVFANPAAAPRQAYSWLVLPDLSVVSFIDDWGRDRPAGAARRFGATFAPSLRLRLSGDTAGLAD
jgi:levansucrase